MSNWRVSYGLSALLLLACRPPVAVTSQGTRAADEIAPRNETGWGSGVSWVLAQRLGLRIPLPSGSKWQVSDPGYGWFVARQDLTHSVLKVRVWREDKLARVADCRKHLDEGQSIFAELSRSAILSRESVEIAGFRSELLVALSEDEAPRRSRGLVVAYGAKLRSCWAAVFTTDAELGEQDKIEARVEQMSDQVIRRVEAHTVEQRIGREQLSE